MESRIKNRILVIFTGGTISCALLKQGIKGEAENQKPGSAKTWEDYFLLTHYVETHLKDYNDRGICFDTVEPFWTDSSNMTISKWNSLISVLKEKAKETENEDFSQYDGIIIAHGTDTLAYTASLLSVLLSHIEIPVVLVSSNEHIRSPAANGNKNFEDAVNFICNKTNMGTYVAYSYDLRKTYFYLASQITQSIPYINTFGHFTGIDFGYMENGVFRIDNVNQAARLAESNSLGKENILKLVDTLKNCVLIINPYVGLDYSHFNLNGIKAVLHNTYHSFTMCTENEEAASGLSTSAIDFFEKKCRPEKVPLYFSSFDPSVVQYGTTAEMMQQGANFITNQSVELSYAKLLIWYSSELVGNTFTLNKFLNVYK